MTDAVRAFAAAWESLHELPVPGDAVAVARWNNARRHAVSQVAAFAATLPRITIPLAPPRSLAGLSEDRLAIWFDWEHLRVNVYHRVAPGLLRWEGA